MSLWQEFKDACDSAAKQRDAAHTEAHVAYAAHRNAEKLERDYREANAACNAAHAAAYAALTRA